MSRRYGVLIIVRRLAFALKQSTCAYNSTWTQPNCVPSSKKLCWDFSTFSLGLHENVQQLSFLFHGPLWFVVFLKSSFVTSVYIQVTLPLNLCVRRKVSCRKEIMLSSFWLRVFANEFDREMVIHFIYACKYSAAYLNSRVEWMWKLSRSLEEIAACGLRWKLN